MMTSLRLVFYALYIALGVAIVVRTAAFGLHYETLTGFILGFLLIGLGVYRLVLFARLRRANNQ